MADGKVAIVTASGKGMGAAIARRLHADGYRLALLSPSGAAETLAMELGGIAHTGSTAEPDDLKALVDKTMDAYGRIDAVANNTGHAPKGPLLEIADADWHATLDLLLLNVIRMCRLVTPIMKDQGGGAIVNISTYATFEPESLFPTSGVVRAGLASFTKLYVDDVGPHNIRMNNILPGFIDSLPEKPERRARVPLGRYGTVEEIAATAAFLLGDGAGYITGQNLRVDGGVSRSV